MQYPWHCGRMGAGAHERVQLSNAFALLNGEEEDPTAAMPPATTKAPTPSSAQSQALPPDPIPARTESPTGSEQWAGCFADAFGGVASSQERPQRHSRANHSMHSPPAQQHSVAAAKSAQPSVVMNEAKQRPLQPSAAHMQDPDLPQPWAPQLHDEPHGFLPDGRVQAHKSGMPQSTAPRQPADLYPLQPDSSHRPADDAGMQHLAAAHHSIIDTPTPQLGPGQAAAAAAAAAGPLGV